MMFSEKPESLAVDELNLSNDKKRTYSAFYRTETEESSSVGNENSHAKEEDEEIKVAQFDSFLAVQAP
jgi:hypothetical protein